MRRERQACVYTLSSGKHATLYIGVTSDLVGRLHQHRTDLLQGFTSRYGVKRLIWFEEHGDMLSAIAREKRLKKWKRDWKVNLIEASNPEWVDLALAFGFDPVEPR